MNATARPAVRVVPVGVELQLHLSPVVLPDGAVLRLDLRLFRLTRAEEPLPTQAGFRIALCAIRPLADACLLVAASPEARATVAPTASLEVRLGPVADVATGAVIGCDLRLFRSSPRSGTYLATRAGFFIRSEALREVAGHLGELADEFGEEA